MRFLVIREENRVKIRPGCLLEGIHMLKFIENKKRDANLQVVHAALAAVVIAVVDAHYLIIGCELGTQRLTGGRPRLLEVEGIFNNFHIFMQKYYYFLSIFYFFYYKLDEFL
jgi:hypothetical protein